jgi:trans-aconitate 2-methyltransferase
MTTMQWDPAQYLTFGDHRLRPFIELMNRVGAAGPANIVDLGCGPGNATVLLTERWPEASVVGVDNSVEMIADAKPREIPGRLRFALGDAYSVASASPIDVLISNATLQWVPGHLQEFPRYVEMLSSDGWFAFQVPGMRLSPSHSFIYDLAASPRWVDQLGPLIRLHEIESTDRYIETLAGLGCEVDAWETTYFQLLEGDDAVLEWVKGSSLRPFTTALNETDTAEFVSTVREGLAKAYPKGRDGITVYPFRRVFVVAHRNG